MDIKKRGQLQISFGMIFSIIIIIATIAIAFYFIQKFLNASDCVVVGDFYSKLQEDIDSAWRSPVAQTKFEGELSSGIESICFGNLADRQPGTYSKEFAELQLYINEDNNFFMYPGSKACNSKGAMKQLKNVDATGFFCKPVVGGKVELTISKDSPTQALVKVKE